MQSFINFTPTSNIFTQIYMPYLWHFATLMLRGEIMFGAQLFWDVFKWGDIWKQWRLYCLLADAMSHFSYFYPITTKKNVFSWCNTFHFSDFCHWIFKKISVKKLVKYIYFAPSGFMTALFFWHNFQFLLSGSNSYSVELYLFRFLNIFVLF